MKKRKHSGFNLKRRRKQLKNRNNNSNDLICFIDKEDNTYMVGYLNENMPREVGRIVPNPLTGHLSFIPFENGGSINE